MDRRPPLPRPRRPEPLPTHPRRRPRDPTSTTTEDTNERHHPGPHRLTRITGDQPRYTTRLGLTEQISQTSNAKIDFVQVIRFEGGADGAETLVCWADASSKCSLDGAVCDVGVAIPFAVWLKCLN